MLIPAISPHLTLYAQNGCNDSVFNIPFSVFQTPYQGKKLFDFQVVSDNGKAIRTELRTTITPHGNLDLMDNADIIVLAGWVGDKPSRAFTQKLQTAHQNGKKSLRYAMGLLVLPLPIF